MKAAIYSPYLDTLGGGEKYMMSIAEILSEGNSVEVLIDEHLLSLGIDLKDKLSKRFNLNLKTVNFIKAPVGKNSSSLERIFFLKKYDVLFYLTDGSIFYPTSMKNILHIQSPLPGQPAKSWWGKIKLRGWDLIIYNSNFTKDHSKENWPIQSEVIYPPVDTDKIRPLKKKKYILSVGRFSAYLKDKKQANLINAFKELLNDSNAKDWTLNLVGSAGEGDKDYIDELRETAKNLTVKFYPNLEHNKLIKLYGESSIYWHASGLGENDPTKMEHFGISTVEAMSAGCVPVVIAKGGQMEIVEDNESGFLWENLKDLKETTMKLIKNDSIRNQIAKKATLRSKKFRKEIFADKILKIVQK